MQEVFYVNPLEDLFSRLTAISEPGEDSDFVHGCESILSVNL